MANIETFKIDVLDFIKNQYTAIIININNIDLIYAEDLVFHLTSSLKITTLCSHLFSLYNPDSDLWICSNQELKSLESELSLKKPIRFHLRIRFIPSNLITKLKNVDSAAFEYYFLQTRYDFLHIPKEKFTKQEFQDVYGIALQDLIRVILEDKVKHVEERIDNYINHINKYCPQNMVKPKLLLVKNKLRQSFKRNYKKDIDVNFVKFCYINQFLNSYHSFYNLSSTQNAKSFHEIYEIIHSTPSYDVEKLMVFQFQEQQIYWKKLEKNNEWEPVFTIEEISSINVLSLDRRKILIYLANQPALTIIFKTIGQMKSLISLLSGYYRLIIHWNLNLSTEYYSPLLNKLKKINCFGPVQNDYVKNRLKNRDGHKNSGLFLIKQSETSFKNLKICFEKDDQIDYFELEWKQTENPVFLWKENLTSIEVDYSQLLILIRKEKKLFQPILSSENDFLPDLLLCRRDEITNKMNIKSNGEFLPIIRNEQIKKSILTIQNNGVFCTRIGTVKLIENQEDKVFIKEFIDSKESNLNTRVEILLKEISEWSKLKNVAIMNCKGVVMHPLSILFEHCHITLREYYSTQEFKLNHFNLTEAAFFLAKALDYLYTNNLTHGYIKFDNLYVSYFSKSSLFIKLGDPIGFTCDFNQNIEQPWLPPEYFDENGFFYKKQTSYGDVWAFGTTVWEIFHNGNHPEFNYLTIDYANLNAMPDPIQILAKKCWNKNFYNRIQPSGVFRELVLILSKLYDARKYRKQYVAGTKTSDDIRIPETLVENNKNYHKEGLIRNDYQERLSVSLSIDDDDIPTETTLFDQIEDAFMVSIDILQAMNDLEYIPKETITVLRLIGEGNYGKVYQARHENKFVALKVVVDNKICSLSEEIKILTKLRHRNIVEILGFTNNIELDEFFSSKESSKALVMEFMPLGSLVKFLKAKSPSDNLEMTKFASDIASGLDFLSSKHIIHRDLAARNILVASENSVKIADFGLAHVLEDDTQYQYQSDRGLPFKWHAPESFEKSLFRFESDIWSYGIVLWEMYTYCKIEPYKDIDSSKGDVQELLTFLKQGNRLYRPENCPESVYKLMLECWEYHPERRPKAKEVYATIKSIDEQLRQNLIY